MIMVFEETPSVKLSHLQVPRGWNPCKYYAVRVPTTNKKWDDTVPLFLCFHSTTPKKGNNMNTTCAEDRRITLASLAPKHSALASTRVTTAAQLWYSGCTPKPKPKMTKSPCLGPDAQGKCKSEKTKDLCYLCCRISKTIDLSFLEMKSCCPYDLE